MSSPRLRARVPSAVPVTVGRVVGHRLAFHKRSRDGSGKADAHHTGRAEDRVWGVVFELRRTELHRLDACEPNYERTEIVVVGRDGDLSAMLYTAEATAIDPALAPYSWYRAFLLHGSEEHRLPADYRRRLHAVEAIEDPDVQRDRRNRRIIAGVVQKVHAPREGTS